MKAPSLLFSLCLLMLGFLLMPGVCLAVDPAAAAPVLSTGDPVIDLALHVIPAGYRGFVLLLILSFPYLSRAFYALSNNGGIYGAVRAVIFGTNSVKVLLLLGMCLMLVSCGTNAAGEKTFLLLPEKGWMNVLKGTGQEVVKTVPGVALKNYREEVGKQPLNVQP